MLQPSPCSSPTSAPQSLSSGTNSRKKFSSDEDKRLKELVETHGAKTWDKIAELMPGRTGRQCRDRYRNYLIPGFFNGQWSQDEDDLLREKYLEFGPQWAKMTPFFHGRSANSLKNRWNYFVCRTNPITEIIKKDQQPMISGITLPPKFRTLSAVLNPTVKVEMGHA